MKRTFQLRYPNVYSLSERHGPPRIDLRTARIIDDHGDDAGATHPIYHRVPSDVTLEDLDTYQNVFPFMEFEDLLFYLFPVAFYYERDPDVDFVDGFMYSLDRHIPEDSSQLSQLEQQALIDGLRWMWHAGTADQVDWAQCRNLQTAIGVSVPWDDPLQDR